MCTEYNGWPNYQTWAVNNWLTGSDETTYKIAINLVQEQPGDHDWRDAADSIEKYVRGRLPNDASLLSDLLDHALRQVEWKAVVEALWELS